MSTWQEVVEKRKSVQVRLRLEQGEGGRILNIRFVPEEPDFEALKPFYARVSVEMRDALPLGNYHLTFREDGSVVFQDGLAEPTLERVKSLAEQFAPLFDSKTPRA